MTTPEEDPIETEDRAAGQDVPEPAHTEPADAETTGAGAATPSAEVEEEQASADVMALLSEHIPLALLADLAQPEGPLSPKILEDEGLPSDPWWEQ